MRSPSYKTKVAKRLTEAMTHSVETNLCKQLELKAVLDKLNVWSTPLA
ncbi:hypothetical protein T265_12930, partial [Opisthorchis viverrini]